MINVSSLAITSGTGTLANPWVGWDTNVWAPFTEYYWPSGVYAWSIPGLNLLQPGIAHVGEAGTRLKFSGLGNAVSFDNPGGSGHAYSDWTQNIRFENFIIQGTASCTNGLFLRACRNGIFKHISVEDVSNAGLYAEACVTNMVDNFRCTHHEMPNDVFNVVPAFGIVLGTRGVGDSTTCFTFTNAVIEGVSNTGIWIKPQCYGNKFINGTSEGNSGRGMVVEGLMNVVDGMDFEANGGSNLEISSELNDIRNIVSNDKPVWVKNGYLNRIHGRMSLLTIENTAQYTDITGVMITVGLTDRSTTTIKGAHYVVPDGFRKEQLVGSYFALPPSGTISTDLSRGSHFSVVVTGNATLGNISTSGPALIENGREVEWLIQQDNIGGHTLAYDTLFESMSGGPLPVLNLAPSSFTRIHARWNTPRGKWQFP
jgi:hypothetical protein